MFTPELSIPTREINRNFKIKVSGKNYEGANYNTLVGVSGLVRLVGPELADKLVNRAFDTTQDFVVCKLRRGLKVTFYVH